MVTFANLGSVRLPSLKFIGLRVRNGAFSVSAVYLQQFPSYSNHNCKRSSFFVCPGDAPVAITQNVAWIKRQFSACQTPRSMYASTFNSFPVFKPQLQKITVFTYHSPHFCFPWRRPCDYHWMEREFDAYKLPRWMCRSNYNRFSARVRYWSKVVIFSYPPCSRHPH